tara:strand:- start:29789 stop:30871 length:1083 start_codon:yes stop_codon:yes gene_type:complete
MFVSVKSQKSPFVSIIVPSYNVEDYIDNGLESIINQSYGNWECIVINDGSIDDTEQKIKEWTKKDERFKLISQKNKGLSGARNTGLKHAKGECLFFFDPDDLLDIDCLKNLTELFTPDIDIVVGKSAKVYNQTTDIIKTLDHSDVTEKALHDIDFLELSLTKPFSVTVWNKLYKSKFILSNNITFKNDVLHEDEMWFFETMYLAKRIIFNSKVTYYYNIGNQNSITKNYSLKNLKSCTAIIEDIFTKYYIPEEDLVNKLLIGTYILNLQITIIAAFFRFTRKNKNVPFKAEGISIIKEHLTTRNIENYKEINSKKTKQFELFKRYARVNPEISFRLVRNIEKDTIIKRFENLYLKYTIRP